jgi:hypothetical protein
VLSSRMAGARTLTWFALWKLRPTPIRRVFRNANQWRRRCFRVCSRAEMSPGMVTLTRVSHWFNPWAEETRQLLSTLDRSAALDAVLDSCAKGKLLRRDHAWFTGPNQLIVRSPFGVTRASLSIDSHATGSVLTIKLFSPPLLAGAVTLFAFADLGLTAVGTIQSGMSASEILGPLALALATVGAGSLLGRSGARKLSANIAKVAHAKPALASAGDTSDWSG